MTLSSFALDVTTDDHPDATPLIAGVPEAATGSLKIVVASDGAFDIGGHSRTAFLVGARLAPLSVGYDDRASCREWSVPAWMAAALFDVRGDELVGRVVDLTALPSSPFTTALARAVDLAAPDPMVAARLALANWSAGRGRLDERHAAHAWMLLRRDPRRTIASVADALGIGSRRLQDAVRRHTGLTPVAIRRLTRFDRVRALLATSTASLATLALDAGHADQSHMTREVVALAGTTPFELRRALRIRSRSDDSGVPS